MSSKLIISLCLVFCAEVKVINREHAWLYDGHNEEHVSLGINDRYDGAGAVDLMVWAYTTV